MKAIVYEKYGSPDVLELRDLEKPVPTDDEVLVRVYASSVNPAEWYAMMGLFIARLLGGSLFKPKDTRLGADFAGVVEAVGSSVKDFRLGDEVYGGGTGAFAEYVSVRNAVTRKAANQTFEEAAAVPIAGLTALQGLRDYGKLQPGQKVLITGASGGVGTYAVQIAKAFGAEVTGVCRIQNVELVRSLGADYVVDYTREDFTRSERRYDLAFEIASTRSWSEYKRILKHDAIMVLVGAPKGNRVIGPLGRILKLRLASLGASQKMVFFIAKFNREDLAALRDLIEAGKVRSIIDRRYELSELPEAMRYLGEGHAQGKIVVTMQSSRDK